MLTEYIASLLEPRATYNNWDNFWYDPVSGGSTVAGPSASPDAAMHVSAFFNGIRILSETIAQPPLILYERTGEDQKEKARDNPLFNVLHNQPNGYQSSFEYRMLQVQHMLLGGNAYSHIIGGNRGAVEQLIPLPPGNMRVKKLPSGRLGYMYRDDGHDVPYTQDEIFHRRAFPLSPDGLTGQSILSYARQTIGLSLATENFGSRLFNTDAKQRGNYSVPGSLTPPQLDAAKLQIQASNGLMVLQNGATWVQTGMTALDAEFLTTRKFEIAEICRWLNIQPHLLKDLSESTNNNIEHQGLEFLQFTLMPYFINWEQAILRDLIVQKNRFFAEFLVDGLVRANIEARYNAYATAINSGFMTRNQPRVKENWNKAPGLDTFLVDQNKAIVDKNGKITPVNKPEGSAPALPDVRRAPAQDDEESAHYRRLSMHGAERISRREAGEIVKALAKHAETPEKLAEWADKFYANHAEYVAREMQIGEKPAKKFAENQKTRMLLSVKDNCANLLLTDIESNGADGVIEFVRSHRNGHETREAV